MLDKINSVFFEEAAELLEQLEGHLLSLDENPNDKDIIAAVFRAMHTIKGSSGMFGFDEISKFTHEVENTFDMVRNGEAPVTKELISLTLKARDHIKLLLDSKTQGEYNSQSQTLIQEFKNFMAQYSEGNTAPSNTKNVDFVIMNDDIPELESVSDDVEAEEVLLSYKITFAPSRDILKNGTRPKMLVRELADLGDASILMFLDDIPPLSQLDTELCYVSWTVFLTTKATKDDIQDVFIFVNDDSKIDIRSFEIDRDFSPKIGEILIHNKIITKQNLDEVISKRIKVEQMLVEENLVTPEQLQVAILEQEHYKNIVKKQNESTASQASQSIRVSSDKLDMLIDIVGELVTFTARLNQISQDYGISSLLSLSEQGEKLILNLRDTAMDMRMLPIGTIFSRFRRLVRDLSSELGKDIELETEGAETELDKTVIEKLNDPLVHLIRNSIDHGIEMPEVRKQKGKNPVGTVKLIAKHAGAFVLITIQDDGAGLNTNKIHQKALEKGIIGPNAELSTQEINELIFAPGFSTADKVSSISGRGVGMDVVKKDITALNGTVSVESKEGEGSSFILKLPLTLAIIEGMLVQIGNEKFIIPLSNIEECLIFNPPTEDDGSMCSYIDSRGTYLPYVNLRTYFEIEGNVPKNRQVVVVNDSDSKIGLVVDSVIGNHQTVIKPLGKLYSHIDGLSGATILGDGSVALILDVFKLVSLLKRDESIL